MQVPSSANRAEGDIHIFGNPHYWLDPLNGKVIARNIANGLERVDPADKATFEANLQTFYKNIDDKLNRNILCEGCKEKKVEKLITKCGNEEMAKLLYKSKLNSDEIDYIRWIPFSEFGNIEYLAKGGFGEVQKAVWFGHYYKDKYSVVLKRLYNSSSKILDILKEVNKKKF